MVSADVEHHVYRLKFSLTAEIFWRFMWGSFSSSVSFRILFSGFIHASHNKLLKIKLRSSVRRLIYRFIYLFKIVFFDLSPPYPSNLSLSLSPPPPLSLFSSHLLLSVTCCVFYFLFSSSSQLVSLILLSHVCRRACVCVGVFDYLHRLTRLFAFISVFYFKLNPPPSPKASILVSNIPRGFLPAHAKSYL